MTEDNKYYVPDLNEFHCGFEFEVNNTKDKFFVREHVNGWIKTKMEFGVLGDILNIQRLLLDKQIRIKVLDREDIESFGFDFEGVPIYNSEEGDIIEGFSLRVEKGISYVLHSLGGNKYVIYSQHVYNEHSGNWTQRDLFVGEIKNKSVLKQVVGMVG